MDSTLGGMSVLLVVMMIENEVVCDGVDGKWGRVLYGRSSLFDRLLCKVVNPDHTTRVSILEECRQGNGG
jgi:hypothetical protein